MALNQNREPDGEVGVGSVTARGGTGHGRKRLTLDPCMKLVFNFWRC